MIQSETIGIVPTEFTGIFVYLMLLVLSSQLIFSVVFQSDKDFDPFAERRRPTIAEKEDEYRQKRRRMIISPERVDLFAEGLFCHH